MYSLERPFDYPPLFWLAFIVAYVVLCYIKSRLTVSAKAYYFCYCTKSKNNVYFRKRVSYKEFRRYEVLEPNYPILHVTNTSVYFLTD